jgi:hypothetical protein
MMQSLAQRLAAALLVLLLSACAGMGAEQPRRPAPWEPAVASVVIIPPINNSPDMRATYSVLSRLTVPLAEAGYYVFPVSLVDSTFKQNGVANPQEMHAVSHAKLREVFGADAALYLTVEKFGTTYYILGSDTEVRLEGRLVDLRSGQTLWRGRSSASAREIEQARGSSNSSCGLLCSLVGAVWDQVVDTLSNRSDEIAALAVNRLLPPSGFHSLARGPRAPVQPR